MFVLVAAALAADPPADKPAEKPPVYKFDEQPVPGVVQHPEVAVVFTKQDTTYQPKLGLDEDLNEKTVKDAEKKP